MEVFIKWLQEISLKNKEILKRLISLENTLEDVLDEKNEYNDSRYNWDELQEELNERLEEKI